METVCFRSMFYQIGLVLFCRNQPTHNKAVQTFTRQWTLSYIFHSFFKSDTMQMQLCLCHQACSLDKSQPIIHTFIYSDHNSHLPAGLQRSWAMSSDLIRMQLFIFQSKQKASQSIGQKFREKQKVTHRSRPPPHSTPNTHIHNQTCTHAHKHPRLADRDGRDDSDLLIYESFYSVKPPKKMMWVQMDGDPDPGRLVAQTKCLWWRKRRIEGKWKSFQRVLVELQLLACWWVSQNSELLSWEKPATLLDPHS